MVDGGVLPVAKAAVETPASEAGQRKNVDHLGAPADGRHLLINKPCTIIANISSVAIGALLDVGGVAERRQHHRAAAAGPLRTAGRTQSRQRTRRPNVDADGVFREISKTVPVWRAGIWQFDDTRAVGRDGTHSAAVGYADTYRLSPCCID